MHFGKIKKTNVREEPNCKIYSRFVPVLRCYIFVALQPVLTFSESAMETLEQYVKSVQSLQ